MPSALVGREGELAELVAALDRAVAGRGGVVLVAGPAGIGKTRLCDQLHALARGRGVSAGWAVCWESAPALVLAPWLDLLDQLGRDIDPVSGSDDPAVSRAILFERVLSAVRELAEREPRLLVLDDVQWAEPSSLDLLGRAIGALHSVPVLVLATMRTSLGGDYDTEQLAELARRGDVLALRPLDDEAVAALAVSTIGREVDDALRDAVVRRAAGNPLFARELASLVATSGSSSLDAWLNEATHGVPHALRSLLSRPVDELSASARSILAVVAVAGDHATVDVVSSAAAHLDETQVLRSLAEAERAGVILASDAGSYRLHHPLLRTAVLDRIDPVDRAALHHRIGAALELRAAHDPAALVAQADHLLHGASTGDARRAVESAQRAASALAAGGEYEQAATLLRRALAILERDASAGDHGEVLLALGAAHWASGDSESGRRALVDAARRARDEERFDLLARAALALGGPGGFEVRLFDRDQVLLLEDALRGLGNDGDPALRSWVSARLSVALSLASANASRAELVDDAVDLARASGDPAALAHALAAWCDVNAGPDRVEDRAAAAAEIIELARRVRDPAVELLGLRLRVVARLEAGDLGGADSDIEAFARVAGLLADPRFDWVLALWRGMRALHDGRVEAFLSWNDRVAVLGEQAGSPGADVLATGQRWLGLVALDRVDEAVELWRATQPEERFAHFGPMMMGSIALASAYAGDLEHARRLLDRFDLDELPKDSEWLSTLSQLADAIVRTGTHPLAPAIRDALAPYADLWVIDGIGSLIRGSVQQWIDALSALTDGPHAMAVRAGTPNRFTPEGDVWVVTYDGSEVHVRDSKGMRDLATLLARPRQDVAALDLMAGGTGTVVQSDAGPMIDDVARDAYRERIETLHVELDAADEAGDAARSERLHTELEALTDELRRATGLGGRARREGASAQRARTAVTGRIRDAIQRIDVVHPTFAAHLRSSIRTGTTCSYDPPEPVEWQF